QLNALDQTILQAKKQLEATFDSIADGIIVIDTTYRITRLNKTYAKFINQPLSNILGQKCYYALRNLDHHCPECPITNISYHEGYSCILNGSKLQIEVTPNISDGLVENYIETIRDVTRFESLHEQLRRSERLATIGTMVAGIAHEMNNPLSGISGNSQLMLATPEKYGLNPKGASRVKTIFDSVQKATQIMEDLLHFARPSNTHFRRIHLKDLFNSGIKFIEKHNIESISFATDTDSEPLAIWGNHEQLQEIFGKILLNSVQAIQEVQSKDSQYKGEISLSGKLIGNNVMVSISDNGCGIPEKNIVKVFDPFFTTKEPGKGVGLGLSLAHRVITEHFSNIKIISQKAGTQVQIIFPVDKPDII
ncbi:MAG: hypothetical protein HQK83_16950, partial [Fibrobacteria bacterium]|nr:hypothetical protein [Fibrobacteria bacterium]